LGTLDKPRVSVPPNEVGEPVTVIPLLPTVVKELFCKALLGTFASPMVTVPPSETGEPVVVTPSAPFIVMELLDSDALGMLLRVSCTVDPDPDVWMPVEFPKTFILFDEAVATPESVVLVRLFDELVEMVMVFPEPVTVVPPVPRTLSTLPEGTAVPEFVT